MPEKYEVRKLDGSLLEPGTFFVLRAADAFSYAALYAYGAALQTAIEVWEAAGSVAQVDQLRPIQAQVETLAVHWQAQAKKVPD